MAEICFRKAPGQDLAQKDRFPMVPEEKFNSRPRGRQMVEMCMYASMCACAYSSMHVRLYVCMSVCLSVCLYVCLYVCMYVK